MAGGPRALRAFVRRVDSVMGGRGAVQIGSMRHHPLLALSAALAATSCYGPADDQGTDQARQPAVFGPTDDRRLVASLDYPYSAMGRVTSGGGCTGTLIAPNKVLTAQHCLAAPLNQTTFWRHGDAAPIGVTRIVAGRASTEGDNPHDWAILWLATAVPATTTSVMNVVAPPSTFTVRRAGYSGDLSGLEEVTSCSVTRTTPEGMMLNDCDLLGGASGGPYFLYNARGRGLASLVGIASGHQRGPMCAYNAQGLSDPVNCGDAGTSSNPANAWVYSESYANTAVSAELFRAAPHYAASVSAVSVKSGASTLVRVQALDPERGTLHERAKVSTVASAAWNAWSMADAGARTGLSAGTLQDGREMLLGVTATGGLSLAWASTVGGSIGAWSAMTGPGAPYLFTRMRDTAIGRTADGRTQIYALAQSGAVYSRWKLGDSNSAWSDWVNMGTPVANSLAIAAFTTADGTQQLWVAGASGARTTWLSPGSGAWATWIPFALAAAGLWDSWLDLAVTATQSGRVDVWAVQAGGAVVRCTKVSSAASGAWGSPSLFLFGGVAQSDRRSVGAARLSDGRETVITVNSSGEVFQSWEYAEDSFTAATRFYR